MKGTFEIEFTFAELEKFERYKILEDYIRRENSRYVDRDKCLLILGEQEPDGDFSTDIPETDDDIDWKEAK
jgi:hypothetical protein